MKKDAPLIWDEACQSAFESIKKYLWWGHGFRTSDLRWEAFRACGLESDWRVILAAFICFLVVLVFII